MKVYKSPKEFVGVKNPVLTTGTFDGVHVGHQKIIKRLNEIAKEENGESVVMSFHPHPRTIIFPDQNDLKLLNSIDEKIELLEHYGVQHFIIIPFTIDFSRISPTSYVRDLLVNEIGVKKMVIGYDHQFGRNREGNFDQLLELSKLYDFSVEEISPKDIDQVNVSSTKIRKALTAGDIKLANSYLGHTYSCEGEIVKGNQIGRRLNFPTANISIFEDNKLIPKDGSYVIKAVIEDHEFDGMMNIGQRPTIGDGKTSLEVHLFNFNEEVYNKHIKILFIDRIRDEIKFSNLEELKLQLEKDKTYAESILKSF